MDKSATNNYMIFLPSNKMVKGANRTAICDIQRNKLQLVPNDIYDFIKKHDRTTIEEIKSYYEKGEHDTIDEYLEFLKSKEFIFFGSLHDTKIIKNIDDSWHFPSLISNSIIEYSKNHLMYYDDIFQQLNDLKSIAIQIISYEEIINIDTIIGIMNGINKLNYLTNVEFIIPYIESYTDDKVKELLRTNLRIDKFILHSSKENKDYEFENGTTFAYVRQVLKRKCCGVISKEYFTFNKFQFSESKHFNSCLNQKISIDFNGNIKNCPSMQMSFGNIKNTTLKESLEKEDFKKKWNINKDKINICKDCEFRYICTDCRAYIENPNDIYSKPLKCGYDPYTNEWKEWSKNPLKKQAIEHYQLSDLFK